MNRSWSDGWDQYRYIEFKDENEYDINIRVSWPADDLNIGQIRDRTEETLKVILEEMKRIEEVSSDKSAESSAK